LKDENQNSTNSGTKYILFYNSYFDLKDYEFGFGNQPFVDANCPVTDCLTTDQASLLGVSLKSIKEQKNLM
jgi:alpha-1,3-fucosyltransferase